MKTNIDGFVLAIIAVVGTAYIFPFWGSGQSPVPVGLIANMGISMIFFFYGLKLSTDQLKRGLRNWKLHILVQLSTFLLFPLLVIPFRPFIPDGDAQTIWLAFMFLAALPSTVSSSVVMVSIARGNVPAAIFNASISGLIGIVVTPLWMGLFLYHAAGGYDLGTIYLELITRILLPVFIGMALQRFWGAYARKYNAYLSLFDKTIILIIIYKSFCESFEKEIFQSVAAIDFLFIFVAILGLFFVVLFITGYLAEQAGFNPDDQTTTQFCGTKKSLVHGTIFSKILFSGSAAIGIMLLPIMLFHAMQIFIISIIASRRGRQTAETVDH